MDHWHHYPGCGRAMDLDMVLGSSPGFDVTRAQAMQFGMAPGGSLVSPLALSWPSVVSGATDINTHPGNSTAMGPDMASMVVQAFSSV